MALPYRKFAKWTLSDLAFRESHADRITFAGNNISAQYLLPPRSKDETDEQLRARVGRFRKSLPRHSDLSERLALAFQAFVRSGEKHQNAAHRILEILRVAPAKKKAQYERWGIGYAYKPIDSCIGSTRRGHRTTRKERGLTADELQAETIRTQACRFIRKHANFAALFDERMETFRSRCHRDAEWCAAAEKRCLARVESFEKRCGPYDWFAAMPLVEAAYLYHEQRKFSQALFYYRKTIRAARGATMHEDLRAFVLSWVRIGAKICLQEARMVRMPAYAGPWLPQGTAVQSGKGSKH